MPPPAEPPQYDHARSGGQGEAGRSPQAPVHELAEALTAIGNYVEAATRLDAADTPSARTRLCRALQESQMQLSRADDLLRQLRARLLNVEGRVKVRSLLSTDSDE